MARHPARRAPLLAARAALAVVCCAAPAHLVTLLGGDAE